MKAQVTGPHPGAISETQNLIKVLKGLIEAQKQEFESHANRERRLYKLSLGIKENHENLSKRLFDLAAEEYDKEFASKQVLEKYRHALANIREAAGQIEGRDFSIFEPETDIKN